MTDRTYKLIVKIQRRKRRVCTILTHCRYIHMHAGISGSVEMWLVRGSWCNLKIHGNQK